MTMPLHVSKPVIGKLAARDSSAAFIVNSLTETSRVPQLSDSETWDSTVQVCQSRGVTVSVLYSFHAERIHSGD